MNIRILEKAQNELEDAVDYYNQDCPGLGFEFADEVFRTIARYLIILLRGRKYQHEPAGALPTVFHTVSCTRYEKKNF